VLSLGSHTALTACEAVAAAEEEEEEEEVEEVVVVVVVVVVEVSMANLKGVMYLLKSLLCTIVCDGVGSCSAQFRTGLGL
jgi:hypothetical protein